MIIDIVKVFLPAVLAFVIGIAITPILTHYLYKHKMWKHTGGKVGLDGKEATEFNAIHKDTTETGTPRMGGIIIWVSTFLTVALIWVLSRIFPTEALIKLEFVSRSQTWIPLMALIIGGVVGFANDLLDVRSSMHGMAKGLSLKVRLGVVTIISGLVGAWFFFKLDVTTLGLPVVDDLTIGWAIIPLFVIIAWALYASGVIDGIDGLSGGIFATIFASYAGIAFYQQQIDLAAFSATVVGAILAFLWFNIPPARFYMTETGTMGLTITLAIVAFMTDSLGGGYGVIVLPVIAVPLVVTVLSNIIQVSSKKIRGKKVFKIAPIHHHFEAIGWPSYKVTMRFWIIGVIFAILGISLALIG